MKLLTTGGTNVIRLVRGVFVGSEVSFTRANEHRKNSEELSRILENVTHLVLLIGVIVNFLITV